MFNKVRVAIVPQSHGILVYKDHLPSDEIIVMSVEEKPKFHYCSIEPFLDSYLMFSELSEN